MSQPETISVEPKPGMVIYNSMAGFGTIQRVIEPESLVVLWDYKKAKGDGPSYVHILAVHAISEHQLYDRHA